MWFIYTIFSESVHQEWYMHSIETVWHHNPPIIATQLVRLQETWISKTKSRCAGARELWQQHIQT